jgi:transposase, IS5 family
MRQERTVQATIFEVFAQHDIGCELKAMSQWLDGQRGLIGLVAADLGVKWCARPGGGDCRRKACRAVPCSSSSAN